MKRALVISGGGSKGAFAGGVAQYLINDLKRNYDIFLGSSTGSLLIPHLAVGDINRIKDIYTNVNQKSIFNIQPFNIRKKKNGETFVGINHFNVLIQFLKGRRTFGESKNLKKLIKKNFTIHDYNALRHKDPDVIITVTNLTTNKVEYKSIKEHNYNDFCDWIWFSCNYVPFMSLEEKNGFEYADGGFSRVVPIREAINRGADEIDVIILETEHSIHNRVIGKNPFSMLIDLFGNLLDQVENHNIIVGKLAAKSKGTKINFIYTPTKLTDNPLIFNKKQMEDWWEYGYVHAKDKFGIMNQI